MSLLNPKEIILDAIKSKLKGTGVESIIMSFHITEDKYKVYLTNVDNEKIKFDIEEKDISLIKKMFISKITKKYIKDNDKEIASIIIKIIISSGTIKVFVEPVNGKVKELSF
jgi:hypothetical protein